MGLVGLRPFAVVAFVALVLGLSVGVSNGLVRWQTAPSCFGGRHFYRAVDPQPWLVIGKLTLLYQPYAWGCDSDHRYDPAVYEVIDGQLQPKH